MNSSYFVWITSISEAYAEHLVGRLVSHGWRVRSLASNGELYVPKEPKNSCVVISFMIERESGENKKKTKQQVLHELDETMKLLGMAWVSMVVSDPAEASWNINRINFEKVEQKDSDSIKVIH